MCQHRPRLQGQGRYNQDGKLSTNCVNTGHPAYLRAGADSRFIAGYVLPLVALSLFIDPSIHSTEMVIETSTVRTFVSLNKAFNLNVPAQLQTAIKNRMELVPRELTRMKNIAYDFLLRYNAINGDAAVAAA